MKNIKVLGSERCSTCANLKNKIDELIQEKGMEAKITKVTDLSEIMKYGVMSTPAVVVDDEVKCAGRIPTDQELNQWIG